MKPLAIGDGVAFDAKRRVFHEVFPLHCLHLAKGEAIRLP